ncbi:ABC transporter G family member 24 [Platanthera guangdongensis]|uniref:ABC transporter G family member 24 n=1 Tax=Platanthera guangdongensis TaxID=2320717 RepID=A0ABR2LLU6_9ASPA
MHNLPLDNMSVPGLFLMTCEFWICWQRTENVDEAGGGLRFVENRGAEKRDSNENRKKNTTQTQRYTQVHPKPGYVLSPLLPFLLVFTKQNIDYKVTRIKSILPRTSLSGQETKGAPPPEKHISKGSPKGASKTPQPKPGELTSRLCNAAEIKFYFNSFYDKTKENTAKTNILKPNKNCNLSSWVPGCEPGWACSVGPNQQVKLNDSKVMPARTYHCDPCCPGFFCPRGLTCMIRVVGVPIFIKI